MRFVSKATSILLVFLVLFGGFTILQFGFVPTVAATTNDSENFVDNNTSNVDSHTGHGTSSNFTAQQDANVAFNDTLTEADTAGGAVATWVSPNNYVDPSAVWAGETYAYDESTSSKAYAAPTSKTWTGYLWLNTTSIAKCSKIEYFVGMSSMGAFTFMEIGIRNSTATYLVYNSSIWSDEWSEEAFTTVTNVVAMRLRFYNNAALSRTIYVYEVDFQSDAIPFNYEMDYEFQWTTADYDETSEYLCIRTYTYTNTEALKVDVRSGSSWVTINTSLVASAWNNISITTYLTSATITFRFLGGTDTGDTAQSTWKIECNLIHVWSEGETTKPTYSGVSTNSTVWATSCNFSVTIADETALSKYVFGCNNTGVWANETWTTVSGTSYKANTTKTLNSTNSNATSPEIIQWQYWFNDTSNNFNNTGVQNLTLSWQLSVGWNNVTIFSFDVGYTLAGINASLNYDNLNWSYIVYQNNSATAQYVFVKNMSANNLIRVNHTTAILLMFCNAAGNWTHTYPYQGGDYGEDPTPYVITAMAIGITGLAYGLYKWRKKKHKVK